MSWVTEKRARKCIIPHSGNNRYKGPAGRSMVVEQLKEARVAPVDTRRGRVAPEGQI